MRIVLVGPPNAKKREWAKKIQEHQPELDLSPTPQALLKKHKLLASVGVLSDYRSELFLASLRAQMQVGLDNLVFIHSPLDSFSHAVARMQQREDADLDNEAWALTLLSCGVMLHDSLKYDKIYRVKKEKLTSFERLVDTAIEQTLEELSITPIPIEEVLNELSRSSEGQRISVSSGTTDR